MAANPMVVGDFKVLYFWVVLRVLRRCMRYWWWSWFIQSIQLQPHFLLCNIYPFCLCGSLWRYIFCNRGSWTTATS